jgi:hypothetical protein
MSIKSKSAAKGQHFIQARPYMIALTASVKSAESLDNPAWRPDAFPSFESDCL